jgi:hypothetical protein
MVAGLMGQQVEHAETSQTAVGAGGRNEDEARHLF